MMSAKDLKHLVMILEQLDLFHEQKIYLSHLSTNLSSLLSLLDSKTDTYRVLRTEWEKIEEINAVELDPDSPKNDHNQLLNSAIESMRKTINQVTAKEVDNLR